MLSEERGAKIMAHSGYSMGSGSCVPGIGVAGNQRACLGSLWATEGEENRWLNMMRCLLWVAFPVLPVSSQITTQRLDINYKCSAFSVGLFFSTPSSPAIAEPPGGHGAQGIFRPSDGLCGTTQHGSSLWNLSLSISDSNSLNVPSNGAWVLSVFQPPLF